MGAPLTITREDHTASSLRCFAGRCQDAAQVRRVLAIALVFEGRARSEAAAQNGMDRQTLRDWVHRYNGAGLDGSKSRTSPGRAPALTAAQMAELKALVIQGPDLDEHKVVPSGGFATGCFADGSPRGAGDASICRPRWRGALPCWCMRARSASGCTSSVWPGCNLVPAIRKRAWRPSRLLKNFAGLLKAALLSCTAGTPVESWFQDEARVGQKGTHAYVWAPIGSRPVMVRDNRHTSAYLFGAICHRLRSPGGMSAKLTGDRAVGAAIIMPAVNAEAMSEHLKEISRHVAPGAHAALICDRAGPCQLR